DDMFMVGEETRKAIETTDPNFNRQIEHRILYSDGTVGYISVRFFIIKDEKGNTIKTYGVNQDITERKLSEETVNKIFERFNLAATAANIGVWDRNLETKTLTWDERMYNLYEIKENEFNGTYEAWLDILLPEDREQVIKENDLVLKNGKDYDTEFRIITPDNSIKHIKSYGRVIKDHDGIPIRIIGVNYDITEQRQAEEELLKSREKLSEYTAYLQTARENEREIIARELHDEMGQILSALNISVSSLIRDFKDNSEMLSRDELIKEYESLQSMINLTIQRVRKLITELRLEVLGEFSIYEAIIAQFNELKKNTGIEYHLYSNVEDIELDKEKSLAVFRIVQESITNIIKHSKATNVDVVLNKENGGVHLKIYDNGIGFADEQLKHKKTWGLTGMKERTQGMNGSFSIKSNPGSGTEVDLIIPFEK
ncbi:PAS domain-containing protein, partial [Bacteroidota bacterium]